MVQASISLVKTGSLDRSSAEYGDDYSGVNGVASRAILPCTRASRPGRSRPASGGRRSAGVSDRVLACTAEEAIAHRLRRVYLPLLAVLLAVWLVHITAFDAGAWTASAAVGILPGVVVIAVVGLFYLGAVIAAVRPRTWYARGELRSKDLRE
ncbi:DUF2270 domain-containing protein [Halalkalicoccus subterraneus]|uniref:DUF2270 domain-containing protein n=1 Tax=Halalkalicoccus subterraneus TaxID=2675002 RepID=UPI000EFD22A6